MSRVINGGVRRPVTYFVIAAFSIAMALPLAVATGQSQMGGVFDECYDACDGVVLAVRSPE